MEQHRLLLAGLLACIVTTALVCFQLVSAEAGQVVLKPGTNLRMVIGDIDQVIRLRRDIGNGKAFEFDSDRDAGLVDFFGVSGTAGGQRWSFLVDSKLVPKLQCGGDSPRGDPFIAGTCDDGRQFVLLPAWTGNPPPAPQTSSGNDRIDRRNMQALTQNLDQDAWLPSAADPNNKDTGVDTRYQPGSAWFERLVASQSETIGYMSTPDAVHDLETNVLSDDCWNELPCRIMVYQRVIERRAQSRASR